jgi:hypothetical protein
MPNQARSYNSVGQPPCRYYVCEKSALGRLCISFSANEPRQLQVSTSVDNLIKTCRSTRVGTDSAGNGVFALCAHECACAQSRTKAALAK